jgi:hypothetical protein
MSKFAIRAFILVAASAMACALLPMTLAHAASCSTYADAPGLEVIDAFGVVYGHGHDYCDFSGAGGHVVHTRLVYEPVAGLEAPMGTVGSGASAEHFAATWGPGGTPALAPCRSGGWRNYALGYNTDITTIPPYQLVSTPGQITCPPLKLDPGAALR